MSPELHSLVTALSIALYAASAVGLAAHGASRRWPGFIALVALLLHAVAVREDLVVDGAIYFAFAASLSLFMWQCAMLTWLFTLIRPIGHLGVIIYPLAGASAALTWLPASPPTSSFGGGWPLGLHVLLSLLAYGLLTIAALQALALLMQDRGLRQHQGPAWAKHLPALETMEQVLFQLMAMGLFLLSLSLLSGLIFVEDLFAQHLLHKTVLSLCAWIVFATLLWGRWQFGWRGRKAINWTLGGYASLLLAYFGSKWVLEALLGTPWG